METLSSAAQDLGSAVSRRLQTDAEDGVRSLLKHIGEDPDRDGLHGTPSRVVRAFKEMTAGYDIDPAALLAVQFDDKTYHDAIMVTGIDFVSLCEHHLLPFTGQAAVGYIPSGGRVVGLSKLARLVDCYAKRLQIQERMTAQIADAVSFHLDPLAVGVLIRATHHCMSCRGAKKPQGVMTTSAVRGVWLADALARQEFLDLARR